MKKLLSTVLAIVLTVTCISVNLNSIQAASSAVVTSDPDNKLITVFDSNAYVTDDSTTTQVNSAIKTDADAGYWLGGNSWRSANILAQDGLYMGKGGKTAKILSRNNATITNVDDFEWQFQIIADNTATINTSFVFHAGDNANISSYKNKNNLFAVTLFGTEVDTTKNCAVSNALVLEYGGAGYSSVLGYMRPYDYDSTQSPWVTKENSYIKLDDDSAQKAIVTNKYLTVRITMEGQQITIAVWQSNNKKATYREMSVTMYKSVCNKFKSGDFAIISGANTCNYRVKDMNISTSREVFNSNDYPAPGHVNSDITDSTNGNLWLGNSRVSTITSNQDRLYLPNWKTSNQILERNKADTSSVTDFEWSFDFLGNGTDSRSAFVFHVNDNSKVTSENAFWERDYAFTLRLWGSDWSYAGTANKGSTDYAMPHSIALEVPVYSLTDESMMGKPRPSAYEKDATTGRFKHTSDATYLELGDIDLTKWMNVTIKMVGKEITLTVTQGSIKLTKTFTVTDNQLSLAPAGDFAVIQGGSQSGYKNMKVKTLDSDVDVEVAHEPVQTETGLVYENDFENAGDDQRLTVNKGQNYSIVTEGSNTYYHIDYLPSSPNSVNGDVNISFGPSNIKNFTLNMHVRITNKNDMRWHSVILMGRWAGSYSSQARFFTKGTLLCTQDGTDIYDVGRSGPPAENTTSTYPCHDAACGVSILEWHKVTLVCEDSKYTAYIDGKKIVEGVDEYELAKWGGFGLRTQGINLDIDNIRIYGTPHYDLEYVEEVPTGVLYKNNFENSSLDGIKFTYYDERTTAILTEENGNKFLRAYPDMRTNEDGTSQVAGNGNLLFTFGPANAMDFELNFRLRVKSNTNENFCSTIIGIHSAPANIKWDTIWINILARGTSVSLKDTSKVLGINNLIATTGENRSGATMPSDNRAFGVRPDSRWHDVKVISKGYTYTLYVDGVKYISTTDKDKTFYKGYTALGSHHCIIDVDDINLTNK